MNAVNEAIDRPNTREEAQPDASVPETSVDPTRKARIAFSESYGAAAWLLSHSDLYRSLPIAALQSALSAPLALGQFKVYRKDGLPIAYASWAFLSNQIADRVSSGGAGLRAEEWQSGNDLWLVDLIAPFGGETRVRDDLQSTLFKDRPFRHLVGSRKENLQTTGENPAEIDAAFHSLDSEAVDPSIKIVRADEALRRKYSGLAVPFIKLFLGSGAFKGLSLDVAKVRHLATQIINRPDAVLLVALNRGIPCGGIAGELHEIGFNKDKFAQDIALIIHPRFRGKGVGTALLRDFEKWAKERGAIWVQYVQSSQINEGGAEKLYLRTGASRAGFVYRKHL